MEWKKIVQRIGGIGNVKVEYASTSHSDWSDISNDLAEAWQRICGVLLTCPKDDWSVIVCSVRPDTGEITIAAGHDVKSINQARIVFVIHICQLEKMYYQLPDASQDATGFEQKHRALLLQASHALVNAAKIQAAESIQSLKQHRAFDIVYLEYDDLDTAENLNV